ncbi:MAG TPA: ethanolamine ammonia-lyase subunit EutC, partial [Nocardioidaceae bacterium]|nr:ethanolamine ammonia-lyase subunit EutC [Nocardioidaceae bacterium]
MSVVSTNEIRSIVEDVLAELGRARGAESASGGSSTGTSGGTAAAPASSPASRPAEVGTPANGAERTTRSTGSGSGGSTGTSGSTGSGDIDVPDPTVPEERRRIGVVDPINAAGLKNLASSTYARLAVGRAGPRPRTNTVLLFGADHAVTQDAIFGDVPHEVLEQFGMFTVQTQVTNHDEYLLRPDLGRRLDDEAKKTVAERCTKNPQVQVVVGDGLSAAAVTNNLPQIYPVIEQGVKSAGFSMGTPFFVRYARVGVMNDVNDIIGADVVLLLIGERPGLGVADALSVYSGWRPGSGKSDAHRDVICMITANGGTNPLEAGAFVV